MCQRHDIYGFIRGRAEGSWAEYMRFSAEAIVHKVPADVQPEHAALIEPLACAIHTHDPEGNEVSKIRVL